MQVYIVLEMRLLQFARKRKLTETIGSTLSTGNLKDYLHSDKLLTVVSVPFGPNGTLPANGTNVYNYIHIKPERGWKALLGTKEHS